MMHNIYNFYNEANHHAIFISNHMVLCTSQVTSHEKLSDINQNVASTIKRIRSCGHFVKHVGL